MTAEQSWFGHPRGLTILFLTNMWEQFSYYGMRALLVYYMTKQLLMSQGSASLVYGAYTACAYFTPIVGGIVADRFLGKRRAILIGGSVMAVGHFMMAFEPLFYPALATIALGNGLFLPSLPSQIGALYAKDDARAGSAYNVYYVGVNIGGFLAPLICGTLGELYGWHWGFGAAGVGMLGGLAIYISGQRYLPEEVRSPQAEAEHRPAPRIRFPRKTLLLLLAIALSVTVFRGAYEQIGNTLALWADVGVDRRAGAVTIPMTWFQSLNPLLVMVMTPPLLALWRRRAAAGKEDRPTRRMAVGAAMVAGAYLILAAVEAIGGPAHWLWLVLFFVILTLGELHILPTGLGLFARLAPQGLGATTVAAWFLASFAGSLAAGMVGTVWSRTGHSSFFLLLALIAATAAAMLLLTDRARRAVANSSKSG
ncbi:peptide MFS transporter [Sphingomonas sp. SRS2]|uniref:peptide MFS transporter n=1 Tax=Sphingomonas sp. SRS2 TaxID=133190 RepID=UPI00061847AB|nr:peptide MFS transporter [Sphingomonas sp. SRS2]KKC26049.1 peptide ABC transporter [Sphingomonas sp. SRS2]